MRFVVVRKVSQECGGQSIAGAFLLGAARVVSAETGSRARVRVALGHSDYPQIGKGERQITTIPGRSLQNL
jgi:hypothetical protein